MYHCCIAIFVGIVLALAIFLDIFETSYVQSITTAHTKTCIFSDIPFGPASVDLQQCVISKGYKTSTAGAEQGARRNTVHSMLAVDDRKVAAVHSRIQVDDDDIRRMKRQCGQLLYITSCRRMEQRVLSVTKQFTERSARNSTDRLSAMLMKKIARRYNNRASFRLGPFSPDYVVRNDREEEDTSLLLSSLGCETPMQKRVDKARKAENNLETSVVYRRLWNLSESLNRAGVEKAKTF